MAAETITYDTAPATELATKAKTAMLSADEFVIDSQDMLEAAGEELVNIKAMQKDVEDKRTSITKPLNDALKAANDLFRPPKEYLVEAERLIKHAMLKYTTEQERIAADARREAERLARLERDRLATEQREREHAARLAQEEALRAEEDARQAQSRGDPVAAAAAQQRVKEQCFAAETAMEEANALQSTAAVLTLAPTVDAPAKVHGVSSRVTYKAEVTDLMALVKAVAEGAAPLECISADEKFLGAQARAFKRAGVLFPGVTAVAERGLAARSA